MRAALALALVANAPAWAGVPEPSGYRMGDYRADIPDSLSGARVMHTADLDRLIRSQHPVLIDVLPAPMPPADSRPGLPRIPLPHKDVPGSVWLPDTGRGSLAPATDMWFRASLRSATGGAYSRPVVFYCLSRCWMSWNAAKRAVSYGYTQVIWYPDGADGWVTAGLPVETAIAAHP